MAIFEMDILPTLYDYSGEILICSNSAGKDPSNFFYNICGPQYGFHQYHAHDGQSAAASTQAERAPRHSLNARARLLAELKG